MLLILNIRIEKVTKTDDKKMVWLLLGPMSGIYQAPKPVSSNELLGNTYRMTLTIYSKDIEKEIVGEEKKKKTEQSHK